MKTYYIRAEAVNLGNVIGDTDDLSTVRGSGLMILELSKVLLQVISTLQPEVRPKCISNGASQAVLRIELNDDDNVESLVENVSNAIRQDSLLRYATIVVDQYEGEYHEARETLLAKNRWRQLKQSRLSLADIFPEQNAFETPQDEVAARAPWCSVDQVRPATVVAENVRNREKRLVSKSVAARRAFGFTQKQAFYSELAGWEPRADIVRRMRAAWHFDQITALDDRDSQLPSNLNRKLAVFYVDGNGFGGLQAATCITEDRQKQWDRLVQGQKLAALKAILAQAWDASVPDQVGPGWWNKASAQEWQLRLETLLWGGDELIWVVPAWQGWNVAQTFFNVVMSMQPAATTSRADVHRGRGPATFGKQKIRVIDSRSSRKGAVPGPTEAAKASSSGPLNVELSYAAGMVFCHSDAPIHRIVQLAKELAEEAKAVAKAKKNERDKNLVAYAVLESFDQLGRAVKTARRNHLPVPPHSEPYTIAAQWRQTVLAAPDLATWRERVMWMRDHFPRGAVYKLLRILRTEANPGPVGSEFTRWFERAIKNCGPDQANHLRAFGLDAVKENRPLSVEERSSWLHLAELWDYIV